MDTTQALKMAMQAVREAGIPEDLWPTALPLALADLRGSSTAETGSAKAERPSRGLPSGKPARRRAPRHGNGKSGAESRTEQPGTFATAASEPDFLDRVARQTETTLADLQDVFHIENGGLHLKVLSRDLGAGDKAKTQTVTALMAGAVFAATTVSSIPIAEIHGVCKTMRCYSNKHAAEYVRDTDGFGSIGAGKSAALTHKNGWEAAFAAAVERVLGRADDGAG